MYFLFLFAGEYHSIDVAGRAL